MAADVENCYEYERKRLRQLAGKQQRAAANPLQSVWVSASAGTGKTRVLSDRVLRMLLKNIDASEILCLTYTKAAAVEMKTRIAERLSEWAVISEDDLAQSLYDLLGDEIKNNTDLETVKQMARTRFAALLDTPGGMKIQTIHSFCQEVLQRFPLEAEILPYFSIMEDQEVDEVLHRLQSKMQIEAELTPDSPLSRALQYLNVRMDEKSFPQVMKNIAEKRSDIAALLSRFQSSEDFAKALRRRLQIESQATVDDIVAEYMNDINRAAVVKFLPLWQSGKNECDKQNSAHMAMMLARGFPESDFDKYMAIFTAKNIAGSKLRQADAEFAAWIENEKLRTAEYQQKIVRQRLYETTLNLMAVATEFINRYETYKHRHGKMDYADLILVTGWLLQKSHMADWVLYKLDGGINHILIDEAQDTSPAQWKIIEALSAEFLAGDGLKKNATIFAVGDRKQSIYSFQGADPDKYDAMAEAANEMHNCFNKIDLSVSFRSAPAILETVNKLFAASAMAQGVVGKNEKVNHIAARAGEFGEVQIWPFLLKPATAKKEKTPTLPELLPIGEISLKQQMADAIVAEIIRLREESKNTLQPLQYRDFMVLVQRRSSIVNEFIRACKKNNVPITGADKLILSREIVVQDFVSLGKFLLLPDDDLSLAEVLKSPLFGLNDDDLTELCFGRGPLSLWQQLTKNSRYATVYEQLQTLLNKVDYVRPFELYNEVLTLWRGRYKMTARMGMEIEDALDEFVNLALVFEQDNTPTLQGFIRWLAQAEVEIKRETDSKDVDAVRLMTVHHSKGLQAPVVFLPDAGFVKTLNREQNLLIDGDVAYYPLNKDYYEDNCNAVLEKQKRKLLEENKRLLYVALTRAEDRLYVCGFQSGNSSKVPEDSWYNMCRQHLHDEQGEVSKPDTLWQEYSPAIIAKQQKKREPFVVERLPEPLWMSENIADVSALAKPWTPSKNEDEDEVDSISPLAADGNYYRRGTIIHKLLQYLPQTGGERRQVMTEFLQHYADDISPTAQQQIIVEVMKLLADERYAVIFSDKARAEVPIMGEVEGKIISAQLDRLVVLEDKILIVDFKTNRPAAPNLAETPLVYKKQLTAYAELVRRIYPDRPVEGYILWTNVPNLLRVI